MLKNSVTLCLSLLCFGSLKAQDSTHTFSLEEAKFFALENNKLIKNARLTVNSSEKKTWQAIAQGLPQADVSMDYIDYFNYEIEFSFGSSDQIQLPPLSQPSDPNEEIIYGILQGFIQPSEPTTISLDNSASAKFQVNQLIFNGPYFVGIKTAKI